jgi:hypothetical protein
MTRTATPLYASATATLNGMSSVHGIDLAYELNVRTGYYGRMGTPVCARASIDMTVSDTRPLLRFMAALEQRTAHGRRVARTLWKHVSYGGRKGKAAMRRLIKKGLPVGELDGETFGGVRARRRGVRRGR